MTSWKLIAAALFVCVLTTLGFAQGVATGDLHVTVKDSKGSVVTNATVTASAVGKAFERGTNVNTDGEYRILALPPGVYTVRVEAPGFAKTTAENVTITVGQLAELPVQLSVAGQAETVTVSSEAELVETTRTSTTNTIEQRRIDNLPINGRNYINFALTDSQIVRDNAPSIGAAPTSGLNMSGQRARSNLVNVDGADAIDNSTNGVRSTVSQEAVQEFQIISNSYAAEYGRAAGGVVNIITRSGSDEFHGDVFGYLRNRNFQAVNPFAVCLTPPCPNPNYTRVQAGAAFGGPIKKDRTFYYFSYEITRRHETGFASIGQDNFQLTPYDASPFFGAPPNTFDIQATPQQAAFLQSFAPNLAVLPPLLVQELQAYAFTAGAASGIALNGTYPASFALLPPTLVPAGLKQFPSSCNPAFQAALGSTAYCTGLPASFQTLASQVGNFPVFEGTSLYSLRLDHNFTNSNRIMLRANVSPSTVTGIEVNGENQTFGQNAYSRTSQQTYRDVTGVFQDTWTIGNNKVNDFLFQYARRGLSYFYNTAIPGGSDPAVNIPGFAFIGREPYSFIQRTEERYQGTDNFSWTIGRHDTKFGVDFNYIPITANFTVNYGGVYDVGSESLFPTTPVAFPSFSPVQAYGLGIPTDFIQGIGNPHDSFANKALGVYWQDSFRMRPGLTLNYGLRYDIEFPPQFTPPDALALSAYNLLGLQKGIQTDTHMFQPRVGLAWDPRGNGKSVVRASYGIFFDHPLLGLYFLGDASDGSKSGQLIFPSTGFCAGAGSPANLNGIPIFQGNLVNSAAPQCAPGPPQLNGLLGYLPNQQQFNAFLPNSLFINQNYISSGFPLAFQPFGYPQGKNFVYASSQQVNLTVEQDLGSGFALSLAYNFNGGRHLNRPINANTSRGDLLVENWEAAFSDPSSAASGGPLTVGSGAAPCGQNPNSGAPWVSAALMNFFRPGGLNPSIARALLASPAATCVTTVAPAVLSFLHNVVGSSISGINTACNPTSLANCVPFGDMDANFSNGSSIYHGFTGTLRKRFSNHYEFLASYTWSHAIDDSTDLQSPLAPQDSYFPSAERSTSLFDQRHRLVFSAVYQSGRLSGSGFGSKLFSNWTVAPIVDVASGRPFLIITGDDTNFQLATSSARPNVVSANAPASPCGTPVPSKFSPLGFFQEPCFEVFTPPTPTALPTFVSLQSLDGNLARNAGTQPWTVFNDLRIARRLYFGERVSMDLIADMFNIANKFNVSAVNVLWTDAGQNTAAYDPRQFQFAMKVVW
ncbi:MAG TPA: TonB-dependent receptor [Terriglobales bacterium]|nr:TonB-dependent receptor [Terriglobales bacterium]